ncbi:MAG TPA: hypothetical protein VMS12_06920 [Thermoanaerobaculia bacterium]|nr:hypothetical protein [Thermoanaerobaculia bacterium]
MRCPECNVIREADAKACSACGLLFMTLSEPHRRSEDRVRQKRRVSDVELIECRACRGAVPKTAIRCRHCSEILDPGYLARKARKRRKQVNAASWTAYLLGLVTLFIFRPVGMIAIGAGLMLSILYYLIPVEEELPFEDDDEGGSDRSKRERVRDSFRSLGAHFKRQFAFERFTLNIPHLRRVKIALVGTPLLAAALGLFTQHFLLQVPLSRAMEASNAFDGVEVSARYRYWIVPGVVVYDVEVEKGADASGALLALSRSTPEHEVAEVNVSVAGQSRGTIEGDTFRRMGRLREQENRVVAQLREVFRPGSGAGAAEGAIRTLRALTGTEPDPVVPAPSNRVTVRIPG